MGTAQSSAEIHRWSMGGHGLSIETSKAVLDEIRAAAVAGLCRFPRGGVEVGGILLGTVKPDLVRVLGFRPVECEYLFGPSFVLSPRDGERLASALAASRSDPAIRGLEPVGWYHSHTRSEIYLSEPDLETHRKYFPKPWQVALVVRPEPFGSARAGFFVREPDGSIRAEATYSEFVIRAAGARARRAGAGAQADVETVAVVAEAAGSAATRIGDGDGAGIAAAEPEPELQQEPEPVLREPAPAGIPPEFSEPEAELPEPEHVAEPFRPAPATRQARGPRARPLRWAWAVPILAGVLAWAAGSFLRSRLPPASDRLSLRVLDMKGQLEIGWDRNAAPIRNARSASLDILDGTARVHLPFDAARLQAGGVTYARHSDNIEVRLKVASESGTHEEFVRFLGRPVPPPPPAVSPVPAVPVAPVAPPVPEPQVTAPEPVSHQRRPAAPPDRPIEKRPQPEPLRTFNVAKLPRPVVQKGAPALPSPPQVATAATATRSASPSLTPSTALAPPPPAPAPAAAAPAQAVPAPEPPAYSGPHSGRILWTGQLAGREALTIDGQHASAGYVNAELPGVPVRVSVHPAELTSRGLVVFTGSSRREHETAGPQNGWNETTYERDTRRASGLLVVDPPSAQNGWKHVSVRNDGPAVSVVVIDWKIAE